MKAKPKRVGARAAGSCLRASGAGLGALGQSNHVAQTNLLFGQIRRRGVRVPVSAGAGTTARLCALTKECTRGVSDLERRGGGESGAELARAHEGFLGGCGRSKAHARKGRRRR